MFPYKGKLLGISEDSKGNEEIYSSDIDGSNRKVKKKLESSNMFINEGVIAKDSFFYVATMPCLLYTSKCLKQTPEAEREVQA